MKPRNTPNIAEAFMQTQDEIANVVAALTGIKAQFVNAGWAPESAEQMIIEMYRKDTP